MIQLPQLWKISNSILRKMQSHCWLLLALASAGHLFAVDTASLKNQKPAESVVEGQNTSQSESSKLPRSPSPHQVSDQKLDQPSNDREIEKSEKTEQSKRPKSPKWENFHRPNDPRPRRSSPPKKAVKPTAIRMRSWRKSYKTDEKNAHAVSPSKKNGAPSTQKSQGEDSAGRPLIKASKKPPDSQ